MQGKRYLRRRGNEKEVMKTLNELAINEQGVVKKIKDAEDTQIAIKLMEMGILSGVTVKMKLKAPFADPIAIEVLGYQLLLRKAEAELIEIEM